VAVPLGTYLTHPPAYDLGGEESGCRVQELRPAVGYRLSPGPVDLLALRVRLGTEGPIRFESIRVTYTVKNKTYFQDIPFMASIKLTANPRRPRPAERLCLSKTRLLPQGHS
jgi:hypothetical protein